MQSQRPHAWFKNPFSLATDESNNSGLQKITIQFLDMCLTSAPAAEIIFSKIDETLSHFEIYWSRCVAFGADNTSVNMGIHNSIKTRI